MTSGTFFIFLPGLYLLQAIHLSLSALRCLLVNCLLFRVLWCLSLCFYPWKPTKVELESRAYVCFSKAIFYSPTHDCYQEAQLQGAVSSDRDRAVKWRSGPLCPSAWHRSGRHWACARRVLSPLSESEPALSGSPRGPRIPVGLGQPREVGVCRG